MPMLNIIADNDPPDIHFLPMGYMYLARTPEEAEIMKKNWKMQTLGFNFFFSRKSFSAW